jgi:hypothetical protein
VLSAAVRLAEQAYDNESEVQPGTKRMRRVTQLQGYVVASETVAVYPFSTSPASPSAPLLA